MFFGKEEKTNYFEHAEKKDGSMNSTTSEKGTDGKPNNSSAYNHDYYMKNKEKWKSGYGEYKDGDKDFDDSTYTDENALGDTDFYGLKKPDGSWTIVEEDMKWTVPAGVSKEDLTRVLKSVSDADRANRMAPKDFQQKVSAALDSLGKSGDKEFDVDAAARDVIRGKYKNGAERKAALGEDYAVVQKRVNEMMKAKHSDEDGEVLEHHGIRGMKWGIRRFQNPDGSRTEAGKMRERKQGNLTEYQDARYKYDSKGHKVKKTLKNMTNEELKSATTRYELEERYNKQKRDYQKSTKRPKEISSTAGKVVGSILLTSGGILLADRISSMGSDKSGLSAEAKSLHSKALVKKCLEAAGPVAISVLAAEKGLKTG